MEYESMFSSSRWEILEYIAKEELSPLQLAEKLNTSVANISQQLKLLEISGFVQSKKIKNRDKGKPRTLYTISENFLYVVGITNDFAKKNLIHANGIHNVLVNILTIKDSSLHYFLLKLFFILETHLNKISALAYDREQETLIVFLKPASILSLPKSYSLAFNSIHKKITVKTIQNKLPKKVSERLITIYDPTRRIKEGYKNE